MVLDNNSNWIVANPNMEGLVRRRMSWLNVNVSNRVNNWRVMRYEAPVADAENKLPWAASFDVDILLSRK